MAEFIVSMQAYAKMLLHTAKYPHCAVNGVLLVEDNKGHKDKKPIKFVDCIPLFHLSLSLAPMLEAALLQIDAYCKGKGYVIGGYYQANEHIDDNGLNNVARHIGRKVQEHFPEACIFMIDNHRISPEFICAKEGRDVYHVYSMKDSVWKETDKRNMVEEDAQRAAATLLVEEEYRSLVDFDNHLDDVACDWRNIQLNDIISQQT